MIVRTSNTHRVPRGGVLSGGNHRIVRLGGTFGVCAVAAALLVTANGNAALSFHLQLSGAGLQARSQPRMMPGVVLVGFRPGLPAGRRRALERLAGVRSAHRFGISAGRSRASRRLQSRIGLSFLLRVADGRVGQAVSLLRARRAWVRYAEPDYVMMASAATRVPNDPSFSLQWGSRNTGQTVNGSSGTPGADDHAVRAWAHSTGSRSIVIGEVDTGIDYNHPDLAANIWSNPGKIGGCAAGTHGYNVVASSCDPMDDDTAYGGHGTHVAGIMGATGNNGLGVAGMNWNTTLLPVKWLDSNASGTTDRLISALDWLLAAKQAGVNIRVINDSATFAGTAYSQALSDEIDALGANGVLFVTSAGNSGQSNDDPATRRYPCGYDRPTEICVTASGQNDALPSWANYGSGKVDLAAPGVKVYSTLRNGGYGYIDGGSMASAQVSGAAALVLSVQDFSPTALKSDILSNVDPVPALSGWVRTGGRLDVCGAMPGCVTQPPASTAAPVISGLAKSGQTLTASPGSWSGSPTSFAYSWSRCGGSGSGCVGIAATDSRYTVTDGDVGSKLEVTVTATNDGGSAQGTGGPTAVVMGHAQRLTAAVDPQSVPANGTAMATVTAGVSDSNGNPVSAEPVGFSASDPGVTIGAVTDHGDGTYSATLTSSTTAGAVTLTAHDGSLSAATTLTQTAGTPGATSAPPLTSPGHGSSPGSVASSPASAPGVGSPLPPTSHAVLALPGRVVISEARARLRLGCGRSAPCVGTLKLWMSAVVMVHGQRRTRHAFVGSASYALPAGTQGTVTLELHALPQRLLRASHRVRFQASAGQAHRSETAVAARPRVGAKSGIRLGPA